MTLSKLISTNVPTNFERTVEEECDRSLRHIVLSKYTDMFSKKAIAFVTDRVFCIHRDEHYMFHKTQLFPKKRFFQSIYVGLYKMKTPDGTVYVSKSNKHTMCYTSHYFDRYAERMGLSKDKHYAYRDKAIRDWAIGFMLKTNFVAERIQKESQDLIQMPHPKGLGLGVYEDDILILKTFVAHDMLRKNQVERHEYLTSQIVDDSTKSLSELLAMYEKQNEEDLKRKFKIIK